MKVAPTATVFGSAIVLPAPTVTPARIAWGALLLGLTLRWPGLHYATADARDFLLPWYDFAVRRGFSGLRDTFSNYAPAYTYLLILVAKLDGIAPPLILIKGISFLFEGGSALVASRLVGFLDPRPMRAALAFALVWVAPSVIHNGAFWGQAEAVWTFFLLLSLLALCHARPMLGVLAFAVAFSVKAQAIFLAPLGLALLLNGTIRWCWLLLVPAVYLLLAIPTILMGRSAVDVALVYANQTGWYPALTMNAANLYIFLPPRLYAIGLPVGLTVAALAGLAFTVWVVRAGKLPPDKLLFAAAASLFLMPFVLPKMHERYFYAYEVLVLILAVGRPALAGLAAIAQVTSTLTYIAFDGFGGLGIPGAALTNLAVFVFLAQRLRLALAEQNPYGEAGRLHAAILCLWLAYITQILLLVLAGSLVDPESVWPIAFWDWRGLAVFAAVLGLAAAARALALRSPRPAVGA